MPGSIDAALKVANEYDESAFDAFVKDIVTNLRAVGISVPDK